MNDPSKTSHESLYLLFLPELIMDPAPEHPKFFDNVSRRETMITGYQQIRETRKSKDEIPNLRMAAFIKVINKVANCYGELGIFR